MINSWKSFVYAVDQMRQLQRKENVKKQTDLYVLLKRTESEVDEACDKKIKEWGVKENLFAGAGYAPGRTQKEHNP
jgi:predicted Holliday junction resolvase-like endonuclease